MQGPVVAPSQGGSGLTLPPTAQPPAATAPAAQPPASTLPIFAPTPSTTAQAPQTPPAQAPTQPPLPVVEVPAPAPATVLPVVQVPVPAPYTAPPTVLPTVPAPVPATVPEAPAPAPQATNSSSCFLSHRSKSVLHIFMRETRQAELFTYHPAVKLASSCLKNASLIVATGIKSISSRLHNLLSSLLRGTMHLSEYIIQLILPDLCSNLCCLL